MAHKTLDAQQSRHHLSDEEILGQLPAAIQREEAERASGLRAVAATYDAEHQAVVLALSTGYGLTVPADRVRGLSAFPAEQRRNVVLSPSGDGLLWPDLGLDASVPGLIEAAIHPPASSRDMSRGWRRLFAGFLRR